MESATFRKWLSERGCRIDTQHGGRGAVHATLTIHREGATAEIASDWIAARTRHEFGSPSMRNTRPRVVRPPRTKGPRLRYPGAVWTDWAGRSLKQLPRFIDDYEQTAESRQRETAAYSGKQAGDPARAPKVVIEAVQSSAPPRHLVLGRAVFANVESQLRSMLQENNEWKSTSLDADYPSI
jgi:hypothetical protein